MKFQRVLMPAVMAGLVFCGTASAEEDQVTGAGSSATAHLNFQVNVPGVLRFRVGSAGSTIDLIEFNLTASNVVNGTSSVAATAASGDLGNGQVTVDVFSNRGDVRIHSSTAGPLSDGAKTLSFTNINTQASSGDIPAPALLDGADSADVTVSATSGNGNITDASDVWTYTFDASSLDAAPGNYTGQVTYVAASP